MDSDDKDLILKLGELTGEVRGYQHSVEQYMEQNQREHHDLFTHMNYVNKHVAPVVEQFNKHEKGHFSWIKISGVLIGIVLSLIALMDKIKMWLQSIPLVGG